jgi:hypothetical protein
VSMVLPFAKVRPRLTRRSLGVRAAAGAVSHVPSFKSNVQST